MSQYDQYNLQLIEEISDRISNGLLMLQKSMSLMSLGVSDEESVKSFDDNNEEIDRLVSQINSSELLEIALEKIRNYKDQVSEAVKAMSNN